MTLNYFYAKKLLFALTLIVALTFQLSAQEESKYTLLWKIEGKDQLKPSYLFGTMHVDDARVFNFSDAVLPAIENTEKFALEVQPDSLVFKMFSKPKIELAYLQFKSLLNEVDYTALAERFKEVNDFNIEESEQYDPNILMTMLNPDDDKSTDKTTFVDMHLLGHAKTMQKEIIGLEDIDSQLSHFENATDDEKRKMLLDEIQYDLNTYKSEIETLKKIYITGDIEAIDDMIMSYDGYGQEMEDRNVVMTNSIIKQMKNSSVFSAVGAAHLPGNVGLIKMLRDKGYKVTPVEAEFTGVAKNYSIDISKMKWHKFTEPNMGYTVELPGIPALENTEEGIDAYLYTDLISGSTYTYFALDLRSKPGIDKTIFYDRMVEDSKTRYNGELTVNKSINISEHEGREISLKIKDPESPNLSGLKTIFVFKDDIFYQFVIFDKYENLESKVISRFIKSINLNTPKSLPTAKWINFNNNEGAFSIDLPVKPIDNSREVESPYKNSTDPYLIKMYMSSDLESKSNYIIRYNDQPNGFRIEDLDSAFGSMATTFTAKAELIGEPKTIYHDGYVGKQYEMYFDGIYHTICKVFFRGNRTYLLLSQKGEEGIKTDPNNRFFSSFKFTDFSQENIITQEKDGISFKSLKNNRTINDESNNDDSYQHKIVDHYTKNESSGDLYSFSYAKLKPYFKIDTLKNFYNLYKENMVSWTDTIINEKTIKIKQKEGVEFTKMSKKDSILSKHAMWLDNDTFFYSAAYTSKENINSKLTNELLYGYLANKNSNKFDYYSSKTNRIVTDLKSTDSTVFKQAVGAFTYYEFDEKDLPKLYKTVDANYVTVENRNKVIEAVVNEFKTLTNDNTLKFLEKLYTESDIEESTKRNIIQIIPKLEDENSLAIYKKLLFNNASKTGGIPLNYTVFSPYYDSIPMVIEDYKSLLKLNTSIENRSQLIRLSTRVINSEKENKNSVLDHFSVLTKNSLEDLQIFLDDQKKSKEYDYTNQSIIYTYLNYFKAIPKKNHSKTIDEFTKPILKLNANKWLTLRTAETRIIHDLNIEEQIINSLLDSLDTRFSLMKTFHKANKFDKVPKKYYKEDQFVALSLTQYLEDVEEYPDSKNLLGKVKIDGINYYAYSLFFDYEGTENDASYLVLVEADYKVSQEHEFNYYNCITNWELINKDWKTQTKELVIEKNLKTTN